MTKKPDPKPGKTKPAESHPGMMGDGTEEQNLDREWQAQIARRGLATHTPRGTPAHGGTVDGDTEGDQMPSIGSMIGPEPSSQQTRVQRRPKREALRSREESLIAVPATVLAPARQEANQPLPRRTMTQSEGTGTAFRALGHECDKETAVRRAYRFLSYWGNAACPRVMVPAASSVDPSRGPVTRVGFGDGTSAPQALRRQGPDPLSVNHRQTHFLCGAGGDPERGTSRRNPGSGISGARSKS